MPILGDNTDYATRYDMSGNTKFGVYGPVFVLSGEMAQISAIKAKMFNEFGYTYRMGLWLLTNGLPTAVLKACSNTTNTRVYGTIVTLNLPSSVTLDEGSYAFGVLCEGQVGVYGGTKAGHDEYHANYNPWSGGCKDPFGSGGIHNSNFSRTIYVDYTPVTLKKLYPFWKLKT